MEKQLITKIEREKGFSYTIDKNGNLYKETYSWLKDPYTLVMFTIVLLSAMYYIQIDSMMTTEKNFEKTCLTFTELRSQWMIDNPGKIPTLEEVFSIKQEGTYYLNE